MQTPHDTDAGPIRITDIDDPRIAVYRNQKDQWLRARSEGGTGLSGGLFMAEGELVVRTLVRSRFETASILVAEHRLPGVRNLLASLPAGVPVFAAPRELVASVVGFDLHRGVMACGRASALPSAEAILDSARALVIAEELSNHDNLGSIFRSTAALVGPDHAGVLLGQRCCDPLYRKCLRVSMGAALLVPYAPLAPWPASLDRARAAGFTVIALTPRDDAEDIGPVADRLAARTGFKPAILVGAEGPGLTEAALARADLRVRIPITGSIDSLNAAVAAAIALHRLAGPIRE